jgi:hypothetical protein
MRIKPSMLVESDEPKEKLVLLFETTPAKKSRLTLFFKIWGRNIRSRKISVATAMIVVPSATIFALTDLLYAPGVVRATVDEVKVPRFLQMLGVKPVMIEFFKIVLKTKYRGAPITRIVLENTKSAIAAFVTLQVTLALLQTVMDIAVHNRYGEQKRESLVKLARALGVHDTSSMNADQLRISIADAMVQRMEK